jgi:hypothetical protein
MGDKRWLFADYEMFHERKITAINGSEITVDIPVVDTIEDQYGGGEVVRLDLSKRIGNIGIEDIRLESVYDGDHDENHSRHAVYFYSATNSWVKAVTAQYFWRSAVSFDKESSFSTVQDVAFLDPKSKVEGGRRYSFDVSDGIGILFQRCFARGGRHNFVTGSRVTGPVVWLDCLSVNNKNNEGPHQRWSTGLLFDNLKSREFDVENRLRAGSGHGWVGAQVMLWNIQASYGVTVDAPVGAINWAVGIKGQKQESEYTPGEPGIWESQGAFVQPRSLYLKQLEDRLGAQAVDAVTIPEQLSGTIWDLLLDWSGEGRLLDYR